VVEAVRLLGIYRRLIGARVRAQLQYRLSFWLNLVGTALLTFLDFGAILVLFHQVDALGNWSVAEVGVLYGISCVSFAIADMVFGHLDQLPEMIRMGDFDQVLVRPLGSLLQVIAADFAMRRLGKLAQGAAVLTIALAYADVHWTAGRAAVLVVAILAGVAIFAGIWVALSTVVFWLIDSHEAVNAFTYGGNFLAQYPVNIFGPWLRRLVIYVIPLAFVAYFPALFILDKEDELGLPRGLQFASPLVAVLTALAGWALWRVAVRRYRSVGS
jgi:ABC-2 type transport system permease protein